jgi:ring-1,2-phenylacetyl-CoA epoxidase subunit PaaE
MQLLHLSIHSIIRETPDTFTFHLVPQQGHFPAYEAGQFLTFLFRFGEREIRRSYSFSSAPGIDRLLSVTIKRIPNGEISRYMTDQCKPGDQLLSLMPSGKFTLDKQYPADTLYVLIGAGSGITPLFSLLKSILPHQEKRVLLITQFHQETGIIFNRELTELKKKYRERFTWLNLLSAPENPGTKPVRLTNSLLHELLSRHAVMKQKLLFYVCGPPSFMRMVQFTLKEMGYDGNDIRKENFTVEYLPPPPLITDHGVKTVILNWGKRNYRFTTRFPKTILEAALDHGIQLPYSCKGGRCAACMLNCKSGIVKMSINEVLADKDLEEGCVLTCVGYAETDLELEG